MLASIACFRSALNGFLEALHQGNTKTLAEHSHVRLCRNGTWALTNRCTHQLGSGYQDSDGYYSHGICLPLAQPVVEEGLITALETFRSELDKWDEEDWFSYSSGPLEFD